MGWCSAYNCTLSAKKGMRLFCFRRNEDRRSKWLINCLSEIQSEMSFLILLIKKFLNVT